MFWYMTRSSFIQHVQDCEWYAGNNSARSFNFKAFKTSIINSVDSIMSNFVLGWRLYRLLVQDLHWWICYFPEDCYALTRYSELCYDIQTAVLCYKYSSLVVIHINLYSYCWQFKLRGVCPDVRALHHQAPTSAHSRTNHEPAVMPP